MATPSLSRKFVGAAAVGGLATVAVATAVWAQASAGTNVDAEYRVSYPVDRPVTASELWNETISALNCVEASGFRTIGPFPSEDGANVQYSTEVGGGSDDDRRRFECLTATESLAARFAMDNASDVDEADESTHLPIRVTPSTTDEGVRLLSIREDLSACLDLESPSDQVLMRLAHEEPVTFQSCVTATVG